MKHSSLIAFALLLTGCGSARSPQVEVVPQVTHDTIYLNKLQYDSIYISKEIIYEPLDSSTAHLPPFKGGPGRVSDRTVEYRYRLLRDTIYQSHIDTIPIVRTIEVTREVTHIPWLVRTLAWIGALAILFLFLRLYLKKSII